MSKKDETEIGITGLPIPKRKMSAKNRYNFEKKRRENLGQNVGGVPYKSDVTPNYNPHVKEEFDGWVEELWNEGYDLSDWTWEGLFEYYLDERKYESDEKLPSGKTPRQKAERKSGYHSANYLLRGRETRDRNDQARTSHFNRGSTINTVIKSMDAGEEPSKDPKWKNTIAARRRPRSKGEVPNERPGGLRAGNTKAGGHRTLVRKKETQTESIVEYLFVEGYADTIESAEIIANNIGDAWENDILQEYHVSEETSVADRPATRKEREIIRKRMLLDRLKAAVKSPGTVSDVAKEEYEIDESAIGDRARNAVADQRLDAAQRDTQSSVDKLANRKKVTRASASLAAKRVEGNVRKSNNYGPQRPKPGTTGAYKIESHVPGEPAEKLNAVTSIPKDEQEAARKRTLEKAAAMRAKKGIK